MLAEIKELGPSIMPEKRRAGFALEKHPAPPV